MIWLRKHKVNRRWCLFIGVPFTSFKKGWWISKRRK